MQPKPLQQISRGNTYQQTQLSYIGTTATYPGDRSTQLLNTPTQFTATQSFLPTSATNLDKN
jgi:hypothetical protein